MFCQDKYWMEFIDGYNYRINIVGEDSQLIVDSYNRTINAQIKDINENIIVNTDTGSLHGTLYGDINHIDGKIMFDSKSSVLFISSIQNSSADGIHFGDKENIVDLYFNTNKIEINSCLAPINSSSITVNTYNGTISNFENLNHLDKISIISCKGFYNKNFKSALEIGYYVEENLKSSSNSIPTMFFLKTQDGSSVNDVELNNDFKFEDCLTFGRKTLSAPIVKVGSHNDVNQIEAQEGMIIFNNKTKKFQGFTGNEWVNLH
jgi:hypothetical protein